MSTLYADHGRIINSQEPLPIPVDLMTKLWENPSPTSAFAAQNINLSSSDYDFLLWIVKSSTTDAKYFSSIVEKGQTVKICYPFYYSGMHVRQRTFTYSSDTVYAAENADQNSTADNSNMIPISVYGFKKSVPMQASGGGGYVEYAINKTLTNSCSTIIDKLANAVDAKLIIYTGSTYYTAKLERIEYASDMSVNKATFGFLSTGVSGDNSFFTSFTINSSGVSNATNAAITGTNQCNCANMTTTFGTQTVVKLFVI